MRSLNERGAVTALVAVMLVLILVCVALVVDLGHIHHVKSQLQKSVDAAALAAAAKVPDVATMEATALGTAGANEVDGVTGINSSLNIPEWADTDGFEITTGFWNETNLGKPIVNPSNPAIDEQRYTVNATPVNAIKVSGSRTVDHVFFFFSPATKVTADAIAVAKSKVPVLPLAIITCIPANEMIGAPGSPPNATPCGISAFSFVNDQEDTAAWSSLSFGANAQDIVEYMSTEEGKIKFNNVIFGKDLGGIEGIENTIVDGTVSPPFNPSYPGCPDTFPYDYNITCGLGKVAGEELASPSQFSGPSPALIKDSTTGVYSANPSFDPLFDYADNGALPRWYNIEDPGFQDHDYFTRVWSQDGILLQGSGENLDDYVARLEMYATCPDTTVSPCNPYGDDRFKTGNFIVEPTGSLRQNLIDSLGGYNPAYWPNFREVIRHAGYPKVGIINGNATTVIQAFVDNEDVTDGTNLLCGDNDPFPPGEQTLRVNAPVIFAGACEDWLAISNASLVNGFSYVGLSKLLLTRVWTNQADYDCGSNYVQLNGASCSDPFDPGLFNGTTFALPAQSPAAPPSLLSIEGITLEPIADDDKDQGSLVDVYLVE